MAISRGRSFRTRQEAGVFSSLFGILIGLALVVFVSPLSGWYAESQHRADDFSSAQIVDASSHEEGYIIVEDKAVNEESLSCPVPQDEPVENSVNCVYTSEKTEEYTVQEKEQCGTLADNQVRIRQLQDECDSAGTNCEPCYLVAESNWEEMDEVVESVAFKLGDYTITPSAKTNFVGTKNFVEYDLLNDYYPDDNYGNENQRDTTGQYAVGDIRYTYTYLESDQNLLVAGEADNQQIQGATDDKPYVISSLNYENTLLELAAQDSTFKWILRIVSLLAMIFGVMMIFGPLTVFTNIFRFIPFLGKRLDKGIDSMINFIAAASGVVLWILVYGVILLLKNIWLILIVLGVIGVIILVIVMLARKKDDGGNKGDSEIG